MEKQSLQPVELDPLDRRILRVLQTRADISQADLAEEVAASAASCWRRIKALEAAGVLRDTVRLVDPYSVGRGLDVVCQVRLRSHHDDVRQQFETFIQTQEPVLECLSMSGEWDYLLRVVVADVGEYEQFLFKGLLGHKSVATSASSFAMARVKYSTALPV